MKTLTFTVNAIGSPEVVRAVTLCKRITVGEDESVGGYPTTAFNVRMPEDTDTPRLVGSGKTYTFYRERYWRPGAVAGYVDLPTGSTTFFQDEGE